MPWNALEALPGVWHLEDPMGVCMTLLQGRSRALLVDAGYGLTDVAAQVRRYTPLPVTLLLTHGHHDHALGARWFDQALLRGEDFPCYARYTGAQSRARVARQAQSKGLDAADLFQRPLPVPTPLPLGEMDLGGLTVRVLPCPGHTPGSAAVYVPARELLLTGDAWNPCTWLFFPEALDVWRYAESLEALLALPFRQVLCPHAFRLFPRSALEAFLRGLTRERLAQARPAPMPGHPGIDVREAEVAPGQRLVFDAGKAGIG